MKYILAAIATLFLCFTPTLRAQTSNPTIPQGANHSVQVKNGNQFAGVPCTVTGSSIFGNNNAAPTCITPSVNDSTASPVTSSTYTIQCDSGTTTIDRLAPIRFQTGASAITIPLSTASGCSGLATTVMDDGAGTLTFTRTSPDLLYVFNGTTNLDNQTSFTLTNGQFATISQSASGIWEIRITGGSASVSGTNCGPAYLSTTANLLNTHAPYFYAECYTGASGAEQFQACENAARAVHGICDASGLSGTVAFDTGISQGDASGNSDVVIWPSNATWNFTIPCSPSGVWMFTQHENTYNFGMSSGSNTGQSFNMINTSTSGCAQGGYQLMPPTSGYGYWTAGNFGMQQHGGAFTGGIMAYIGGGEDDSTLHDATFFDSSATDSWIMQVMTTGTGADNPCCDLRLIGIENNANYIHAGVLDIEGVAGSVTQAPKSILISGGSPTNHPGPGAYGFLCHDPNTPIARASVIFGDNLYAELGDATTPHIYVDGCRSVVFNNIEGVAESGGSGPGGSTSTSKTLIVTTNATNTNLSVNSVNLRNGSGYWNSAYVTYLSNGYTGFTAQILPDATASNGGQAGSYMSQPFTVDSTSRFFGGMTLYNNTANMLMLAIDASATATLTQSTSSPLSRWRGQGWAGATGANDEETFTAQNVISNGLNAGANLTFTYNGSNYQQRGVVFPNLNLGVTVANASDGFLTGLTINSGLTATQTAQIVFQDQGTTKWAVSKTATNQFDVYDQAAAINRLLFAQSGDNSEEVGGAASIFHWKNSSGTDLMTLNTSTLTLKVVGNGTFSDGSDSTYNTLIVDSGLTATQISQITLSDRGTAEWGLSKYTDNSFRLYDSIAAVNRQLFNQSGDNYWRVGSSTAEFHWQTSLGVDLFTCTTSTSACGVAGGGSFSTPSLTLNTGSAVTGVNGTDVLVATAGASQSASSNVTCTDANKGFESGTSACGTPVNFLPALQYSGTTSTGTVDTLPGVSQAINVDSATLYVITPPVGCTTYPVINVLDTTASVTIATVTMSASTSQYTATISHAAVPSGDALAMRINTAGSGCSTNAANFTYYVQYH
jgi:hypothetical protein